MGAVRCRGTGGHKNKTSRAKNGRTGRCFGAMAGGNFPEHHVLRWQAKSGADGCGRVKMGSYGCAGVQGHGGIKKTREKEG